MPRGGRFWCTDLDPETVASQRRLSRLIAAGAYGFGVGGEEEAKLVLATLDAFDPYAEYLVTFAAPAHSHIVHPNIANEFPGTAAGIHSFRESIASGTSALLFAPSALKGARAYVAGLDARRRLGFPLFAVRGVLAFERLTDGDVAAFHRYFEMSAAFDIMKVRGARLPLLVCVRGCANEAMSAVPCDRLLAA